MLSIFLFGMTFFSIFDINHGIVFSPNWFGGTIAIAVIAITIFPFYMIFDKLTARVDVAGAGITWIDWIGIVAFSFSSGALVVMILFRWTWTFIFWAVANVLFVVYYILLKTQLGAPLLSLTAISGLFTVIDGYIFIRWLKDQKEQII